MTNMRANHIEEYCVAVHGSTTDGFGVTVLDLPGVFSAGDSFEEALAQARDALALHIECLLEDGVAVPAPRGVATVLGDSALAPLRDGAAIVRIGDVPMPTRAVKIAVSIESGLLSAIDRAARHRGSTRSGFLAEAARRLLESA
jgi:predicted RNase H-like HicB family nuclease